MRFSRTTTGARRAAFGLVALGLLASGCGGGGSGGSGGQVSIRYSWWGSDDRAKKINESIALFEEKYPDIKVKTDFQPYQDFWKKFNTQASGGNPPDVFQNSVAFLRKYNDKKVLLDLNSQVKAGNLSLENFRAGLEAAGEVDGKLLGIPVGSNSMSLVIDKKVYAAAGVEPKMGWTWDDYAAGLKKIHDSQKIAGDTGPFGVMYLYDLKLRQNDKAFFTDTGLGFTKEDLKQWWDDGYAGIKSGVYADAKKVEQIKPKSAVTGGLSAGEFTWDNFTYRYSAEGESEYGIAPIPTTDGKRTGQYLSSLMLSGSAKTKHPKEVAQFIDFMVHDPEVGKIMGYDRGVLSTTEQFEAFQPADQPSKDIAAYEKEIADAGVLEKITPQPSGADVAEAAFLRIATDLALGTITVDKAVDQFFTEANTALGSS